jgi:hypothetical protein
VITTISTADNTKSFYGVENYRSWRVRKPRGSSEGHLSMSNTEHNGFREHDSRINYFVKGAPTQNFGDYLPQILAKEFMLHPRVEADIYRLSRASSTPLGFCETCGI